MNAFWILNYVIVGVYMVLNFKYDIQMFQQNSYRISRYWRWLTPNMGSAWRLVDVACLFLMLAILLYYPMAALAVSLVALAKIWIILRRKYKKPLVMTKRVWRLYIVTALLAVGAEVAVAICCGNKEYWGQYHGPQLVIGAVLFLTILSWLPVIVADVILMPVEKWIQQRFINDAKRILREMPDLRIIGITGSYGKTSTKHYLTRILSEQFETVMTPGSFNTPMGVVRTIREHLKPYHQVFVCEMGAKQTGDIKEICNIVHPEMGIITAVGPMHLETFKTLDNVCATKFELADALPSEGFIAINNDFDPCATRKVANTRAVRYGITNTSGCDYRATDIHYSPLGTTFTVEGPDGLRLEIATRLLGECNVSDLLAAIVIALHLGVSEENIRYAASTIEQVEHRLSIKQTPGGVTIIDDAFNSNPSGSKMAADVLSHFNDGKRIIVTPGMVELGTEQERLNREFGRYIADKVDIAIVVGAYNRDAIVGGLRDGSFPDDRLHMADSFNDAQRILATIMQKGDTVLYENDLPDTFK
jgi:UDP-N-acetylmuramoyl-tripeptide--D-alanyl-D-alanine ligase